ncbi:unnamed protein product [Boreogadus saida]
MEFESEVMNAYMQLLVRDFNLDPHMYKYILGIVNENHHWKLTTDSTSCGPFVLKFAECILKGENCKFNTSRKGVGEMRRAIATALLENTDDLTEVCHQCGQTDNPENRRGRTMDFL